MDRVAPYAKAVIGALVAGLTALGTALADGAVSPAEWVGVAIATLGALGAVYAIPNIKAPTGATKDAGAVDYVGLAFLLLILVVILVVLGVV